LVLRLAPAAGHGWPSSPRRRALVWRGSRCRAGCRDGSPWPQRGQKGGVVQRMPLPGSWRSTLARRRRQP
jgi:hypothetical protein